MTTFSRREQSRLAALTSLELLDTPPEPRFDRYTRLAAMTFGVPIALISLVDGERQWFKSRCGLDAEQTPRPMAFCSHAVEAGAMFVVADASLDPRFADNPLVTGEPHIRFYAGQPVFSDGQAVGTLCIIDRVPRVFTDEQKQCLRDLADVVGVELNHAREAAARVLAEQALKSLNAELEQRVRERTAELHGKVGELSFEIARRRSAETAFHEAQAWSRSIIASSYSGFAGTDSEGLVIEWNASAERIFGWSRTQALGRRLSELIVPPRLRKAHDEDMRRFLETGVSSIMDTKLDMPALTATGRRITVEMTTSCYEWKGQRCFGAFLSDISERIGLQQRLEEKQELLDAVLESIDVAVVACDAIGNLTVFNRAARELHGEDLKRIAASEWADYYALYHADGRTPMELDAVPLVRALKGEIMRDEAMTVAPLGRPAHTLLASGRPLRGTTDRALGAVVVMKDVTELNASRQRLADSELHLRTITDNLPVLIAHLDGERRFGFGNAVHQSWLGVRSADLLGKTIEEAFGKASHAAQAAALEQAWRGQASQCEYEIARKNHRRIVHATYLPQLRDGQVAGVYMLTLDATVSRMHERNLHALAHTDALTHLPNRRQFEQALDGATQRAREGERGCALLYLDVDHFKQINDRHGHAAGDAVLVEFARRLRATVRASDLAARLAGDEFTVLLTDVRAEADLELVAKKILTAIRKPFVLDAASIKVTTTIGIGHGGGKVGPQRLMALADQALYEAKHKGRDTYAVARLEEAAV